ncbi:MAG: hypothetical protein FWE16_02930 [Firmicutes bacterium]|nr:hypothetical protein [Bacillota bacterium]
MQKLQRVIGFNIDWFHGLGNHDRYPHLIDRTFLRLESILKSGAILSRKKQVESYGQAFNSFAFPEYQGKEETTNWNGDDFVSVCKKVEGSHYSGNGFDWFIKNNISIILNEDVINSLIVAENGKLMGGEAQIANSIPKEFFRGVGLDGFIFGREEFAERVATVMKKIGEGLPIYSVETGHQIG